jgi:hypothetical protein
LVASRAVSSPLLDVLISVTVQVTVVSVVSVVFAKKLKKKGKGENILPRDINV